MSAANYSLNAEPGNRSCKLNIPLDLTITVGHAILCLVCYGQEKLGFQALPHDESQWSGLQFRERLLEPAAIPRLYRLDPNTIVEVG